MTAVKSPPSDLSSADVEAIEKLRDAHAKLRREIGKVIVGQEEVLDQLLMAIFCRSHALLMGVPGPGQDAHGQHPGPGARPDASSASSSRPT